MPNYFKYSIKFLIVLFLVFSCKKEFDYPPLKQVNDGAQLTIRKMKERVTANSISAYKFKGGDTNLYCTVMSDELSGNFYQQIFVKDESGGAIQLNIKESGGLYVGDKIRINLNNLYLISANSMIYLDSVDVAKNIVKLSSGNPVQAKIVLVDDILLYAASPTHSNSLQSQLIQLNGMEFKTNTLVPTFADAIGKTTTNQTITACEAGKILTVRTSGRSNFAGKTLPKGNGSIVGIVSQYNGTMQLTLREYAEVNMNGPLCSAPVNTLEAGVFLLKDFNDNTINSGGWASYSVTNNSVNWIIGTSSLTTSPFAKISGYVSGNSNSENWLISPAVDISTSKDVVLSFKSAAKYSGTLLEVLISINYTSGDPTTAIWTSLSPNYALSPTSSDYLWVPSGYVSLSGHKSTNTRIAFKYKSTTSGATSYQLDDIVVKERP
ncbi:DUF5689 domain-containing protein [Aurantibacillus circumpalustris]|uniref:DUF5689 domain-containing protein n=1 Tax=Aurantibacillus circumpalustris TaxID=3036359 RepID=UPI00295C0663|nr:DUF5689 domain-containing protein [Aurantibacillus circumpalustris]